MKGALLFINHVALFLLPPIFISSSLPMLSPLPHPITFLPTHPQRRIPAALPMDVIALPPRLLTRISVLPREVRLNQVLTHWARAVLDRSSFFSELDFQLIRVCLHFPKSIAHFSIFFQHSCQLPMQKRCLISFATN